MTSSLTVAKQPGAAAPTGAVGTTSRSPPRTAPDRPGPGVFLAVFDGERQLGPRLHATLKKLLALFGSDQDGAHPPPLGPELSQT
eukprot:SAG22_NODE_11685_length_473_cov_233.371658_1_plen_84_part_10